MELDVQYLIPEMILLAAACVCTLMGLSRVDAVRKLTQVIAAMACAVALCVSVMWPLHVNAAVSAATSVAFPRTPYFRPEYITALACLIGLLSVMAAWNMPATADPSVPDSNYRGEFFGMMLFSLAGVAMIGKVNDLVWLFVALELVSIPTYILVATGRSQIIAQEAGVKYFFLGALAAAIFLFGFSYLYGATGATRFDQIHNWFAAQRQLYIDGKVPHEMTMLALIGILMILVGVGYKIAAVPMHFYTPDVYQGAATPVTAFLAFAPKTAGIIAMISILSLFDFNYTLPYGQAILSLLLVMSVLTMTVGNVLALLQRNLKRIFAYSSIAHSGYMLVGLIAMSGSLHTGDDGVSATIFYLTSYALMNLGAFAILIHLQGKADVAEDLDDIAGVAKARPIEAMLLAICLFSLIGMPLTMGFLGKFYLIQQALVTGHTELAVIVVINAAIAAAYYLRIVGAMYLREPLYPFAVRRALSIKVTAVVCTAAVVVLFLVPKYVLDANSVIETSPPAAPAKRAEMVPAVPVPVISAARQEMMLTR